MTKTISQMKCECEHIAHDGWCLGEKEALVRTLYGKYRVCRCCLESGHLQIPGTPPIDVLELLK